MIVSVIASLDPIVYENRKRDSTVNFNLPAAHLDKQCGMLFPETIILKDQWMEVSLVNVISIL